MRDNLLEVLTGFAVIVLSIALLGYAYIGTQGKDTNGYMLKVKFDRVDGLQEGSDVKVGGIRIGKIDQLKLDPSDYSAIAILSIDPKFKIPTDSSAAIISENLLGGKYLAVTPGGDETMLKPGDEIENAQSSMILENLIGQLIFGDKDDKKKNDNSNSVSTSDSKPTAAA